jgi:hypothetical protein
MRSSTTNVVPIPRQSIWLLNDGIAVSRKRVYAGLNQLAIFKCELLHVSHSLDALRREVSVGRVCDVHPSRRGAIRLIKCSLCQDCGWVCENHPGRPWEGPHACNCGGAGALPVVQCAHRGQAASDAGWLRDRLRQEGLAALARVGSRCPAAGNSSPSLGPMGPAGCSGPARFKPSNTADAIWRRFAIVRSCPDSVSHLAR